LRCDGPFLLGAVPYDQEAEVIDLILRLNMREIQFGRFGNAVETMRRCALSLLVG
ncbi:unnamed protein product, partial [Amoebophrya sp. A25]